MNDQSLRDVGLRFPGGDIVDAHELRSLFDAFPLLGYEFAQSPSGTSVRVTIRPHADSDSVLAMMTPVVTNEFPGASIELVDGLGENTLSAPKPRVVRALWVGSKDALRDGQAAVAALGYSRQIGDILLGSDDGDALASIFLALSGRSTPGQADITVQGLQPESATRPLFARARTEDTDAPIAIEHRRCDACEVCIDLCPTDCLSLLDGNLTLAVHACVSCHLCGEFCPSDAIHPIDNENARVAGPTLARLLDSEQALPTHSPFLSPTLALDKPRVVLGLATVTLMEHAAALMVDGELVAAVEEERLVRERHYRYKAPSRPGASLASDPTLPLDAAWPRHAIKSVLSMAGLSFEDVDLIGLNGMPHRMRHSFSHDSFNTPLKVHRSGRLVFAPHHLCHAASAYGMTEWNAADVLVIDGHGDFETLSWYRADGDQIELLHAEPFFPDKSVGGVFDTITQTLGFGTHGQGSTMALAALGEPTEDFSDILSLREDGTLLLSEWTAMHRYAGWRRTREEPIEQRHRNLAASLQNSLEGTVEAFLRQRRTPGAPLAIAGGVGLSCRMNGFLRRTLAIEEVVVPPGANDAGTAIGAAILADRELTGRLPRINADHSYWGPTWSDDGIARELDRFKIPHNRVDDISSRVAHLLAEGKVICWFQGRMEFGPRALGGRSILADPRRAELKDRVNQMKGRQAWRPFGPSILSGHESEWFEDNWDSRFMLFAVAVKPAKRELIPMVVHTDGSTRPQAVHAATNPRYHELISAFHDETGVPMVVNTSFNTGGEAIVMTPRQAVASFVRLGADYLAIGDSLIKRTALRR